VRIVFSLALAALWVIPAGVVLSAAAGASEDPERTFEDFDANDFPRPTYIDNQWLSLTPGRQWISEGKTTEDGETQSHRIEFTVTDLTKEIDGVRTVVAWVVDIADGEAVEKELAFYAQDKSGNVWLLGEYPEEYEDGELLEAPTWISGLDEAKAGIKIKADPKPGDPAHFQGWGPSVEWTDFGKPERLEAEVCVKAGCYKNVLVVAESSLDEEGAFQLKYYAPGVGVVKVGWRGDDATQEELELVKISQLDAQALAAIRAEALAMEVRAYQVSDDVYAHTQPIEALFGDIAHDPRPTQKTASASETRKISDEEARTIALATVPGEVTGLKIERKMGAKRIVVEVVAADNSVETDVIIDMVTGEVLGTED
jgi:uncharacterized membrane protein YkoI